jgi:hypothetical protein
VVTGFFGRCETGKFGGLYGNRSLTLEVELHRKNDIPLSGFI